MAHGITEKDQMISAGGIVPWHRRPEAIIDYRPGIPAREILESIGADFPVDKTPLFYKNPVTGEYDELPIELDTVATVDGSTGDAIGLSAIDTPMVDNRRVLELMLQLVDNSDVLFETAGTLWRRQIFWASMQMPESILVGGKSSEEVKLFLTGTAGHNPKGRPQPITFKWHAMRVVCANTLGYALAENMPAVSAAHIGDMNLKLEDMRRVLNMGFRFKESYAKMAEELVNTKFGEDDFWDLLEELVPLRVLPNQEFEHEIRRVEKLRNAIDHTYRDTEDLVDIRGTKYGALQAVAAWESHKRRFVSRNGVSSDERRFVATALDNDASYTTRASKILTRAEREVAQIIGKNF